MLTATLFIHEHVCTHTTRVEESVPMEIHKQLCKYVSHPEKSYVRAKI